jgi:hypothetical protein
VTAFTRISADIDIHNMMFSASESNRNSASYEQLSIVFYGKNGGFRSALRLITWQARKQDLVHFARQVVAPHLFAKNKPPSQFSVTAWLPSSDL